MDREALLRAVYAAFNARDIDGVLGRLAPDVDWPNAWEGDVEHVYVFRDDLVTRMDVEG